MSNKSDDFIGYAIVAIKLCGRPGWQIAKTFIALDEYVTDLIKGGSRVQEARLITKGSMRSNLAENVEGMGFGCVFAAMMHGWAWDYISDCWRAPQEQTSPPNSTPLQVRKFEVSIAKPSAGWLPITIRTERDSLYVTGSSVFDPVPSIIDWLEGIVYNKYSRVHIDMEGSFCDFHAFGYDDMKIRFVCISDLVDGVRVEGEGDNPFNVVLDIIVSKYELIESFYTSLGIFWPQNNFPWQYLEQWFDPCDYDSCNPSVWEEAQKLRSPLIEKYLSQQC